VGEVIPLDRRRRTRPAEQRTRRAPTRPVFHFDLSSPFTYLAAERVERALPRAIWRPTLAEAVHAGSPWPDDAAWVSAVIAAEHRARALRMPLVWPDRAPHDARAAMRAASYAAECGRAGTFVLAAVRLAFCGGFDLDDPEVLAEAAAAADLGLDACLRAARDVGRDGPMEQAGLAVLAAGGAELPALRVGRTLFAGEQRIAEAVAAARAPRPRAVRSTG
jgi:2-hydroxychromene-2-carboxylate isomerase